jgi:hypothetical protein
VCLADAGKDVATHDAPRDRAPAVDTGLGDALVTDALDATDASHPDATDARTTPDGQADGAHQDSGADAGSACTCVPEAPAGWTGPLEIYEGMGGPPPPAPPPCSGAYGTDVYDGTASPVAPPATCTCACGAPSNATCPDPVANYFSDSACTVSCGTTNQSISADCIGLGLSGCSGAYFTLTQPAAGGTCAPIFTADVTPPAWKAAVRLCQPTVPPTATGCLAGSVCAPTTESLFESNYCVSRIGAAACPSGYPISRTYDQSFSDTRGCTPCTCGAHAACAGGGVATYPQPSCNGTEKAYLAPLGCTSLAGATDATPITATPSGGPCSPAGGTTTGMFTPTAPTTICCTQ